MSDIYRIFGSELSPYSVKVRSYFRYKGIPHEWIVRGAATEEEFKRYAKLPLIPLVVTPSGEGLQDSTPILETMEARVPEPAIHSDDPTLAFLSALIEEFGDEWGNKWMFHYRWAREVDQISAAERIAQGMMPGIEGEQLIGIRDMVRQRMAGRVWFVGSSPENAAFIESTFVAMIEQLEAHLATRPYLFGGRPAFGDFGLWGQLYEAWSDPTPGALITSTAPRVAAWIERMLDPRAAGDFESWASLEPTLMPILTRFVGRLFLPWSDANARAIADNREEFEVTLDGHRWVQKPQKYHARSLKVLRERHETGASTAELDAILEAADCKRWLTV